MSTTMAREIQSVLSIMLEHMANLEAEDTSMAEQAPFANLTMDEMVQELCEVQQLQRALLKQQTRRARHLFHQLDTDTRNLIVKHAEGFCEYVLDADTH